jgi:hypothetical protein
MMITNNALIRLLPPATANRQRWVKHHGLREYSFARSSTRGARTDRRWQTAALVSRRSGNGHKPDLID